MAVPDLLETKRVASTTHSNVPSQKTPLCCWLFREGPLDTMPAPVNNYFIDHPAPLITVPLWVPWSSHLINKPQARPLLPPPSDLIMSFGSGCGCQSPQLPVVLAP